MPTTIAGRPRPSFSALRRLDTAGWTTVLSGDPAEAARWLEGAAHYGMVEAQTAFAQILLNGQGVPRDPQAAFAWFTSAAHAGHPAAMNMRGRCLERGWGTAPDYPEAAIWYRRAAELGLDWAQYNLANMLLRGRGIAMDRPQAWDWFLRAAEQGHAKSMNLVGRFLEEGWDRPADPAAALAWYHAAARAGDYRAQYNVGTIAMRHGRIADAIRWFRNALETASPDLLEIMVAQFAGHAEAGLREVGKLAQARMPAASAAAWAVGQPIRKPTRGHPLSALRGRLRHVASFVLRRRSRRGGEIVTPG